MRRLLTLVTLFFALALAANAEILNVSVTNYNNYGSGSVCYVNPFFNGLFQMVDDNLSTDHTAKSDAILLSTFFDGGDQRGECRDIKVDGTARIDLPDTDPVFVVIMVTNGSPAHSATLVYWNVYKLDSSVSEKITVNP
jgi:hypothetical protein